MLDETLKQKLIFLADKYETASFCDGDPSLFLRWYKKQVDIETASFIAAMLAFGNRKQFIPKIQCILKIADSSCKNISTWLKTAAYKKDFASGTKKFYRFYSYDDMQVFFDELSAILNQADTMGKFFHTIWKQNETQELSRIISQSFPQSCLVPKGKNSANKRIHMFLRWIVRTGSPVDLGLWKWYPQERLIIPLDVHVLQQAQKLGLIPPKATASHKTACQLTKLMEEVFPEDPARADFALFGLGVDTRSYGDFA